MNGSCRPTPRDVITIGAHSAEEILEALKREFAVERLAFEKLNPVTRGGFQREKEFQEKNGLPVRDWENICCYGFPGIKTACRITATWNTGIKWFRWICMYSMSGTKGSCFPIASCCP